MPAGQLCITVVNGKGLRDTELFSRQDPYVVIEAGSSKVRSKTHTDGGKNPTWNEKFEMTIGPTVQEIKMAVWNSNVVSSDDLIGRGHLSLQQILASNRQHWMVQLMSPKGKSAGEVAVIVEFTATPGTVSSGGSFTGAAAPAVGPGGELVVQVLRGLNLKDVEALFHTQDPYAVVQIGSSRFQTRTARDDGKNPKWGDKFTFTVGPHDTEIRVECWDKNQVNRDKIIGTGRITISAAAAAAAGAEQVISLTTEKGRSAGDVVLIVTHKDVAAFQNGAANGTQSQAAAMQGVPAGYGAHPGAAPAYHGMPGGPVFGGAPQQVHAAAHGAPPPFVTPPHMAGGAPGYPPNGMYGAPGYLPNGMGGAPGYPPAAGGYPPNGGFPPMGAGAPGYPGAQGYPGVSAM